MPTLISGPAGLAASIGFGAVRLALGALWLHEGWFKYAAHFGRADILLVAHGATGNTRVPGYFDVFAESVLDRWPSVLGFIVPLAEVSLGVALIVGILTLPAAAASAMTLMMYWSSDQLIAQYPVMGALSVVVLMWPLPAARISATALLIRRRWSDPRLGALIEGRLRRWL